MDVTSGGGAVGAGIRGLIVPATHAPNPVAMTCQGGYYDERN
ncbi:hypothetical protein [Methylomagnum sp.]